jgi:hypothetical protein
VSGTPSPPAAELSPPAALPDPPGRAADLVAALAPWATAGFSAGLLCHLLAPAAVLRGWTGADAESAAAQLSASSRVAAALHEAMCTAVARLQAHAEMWLLVENRLAVLRRAQEEQFAAASTVLSLYANPVAFLSAGNPPAGAAALVAAYEDGEVARIAEHRALLAEVAEDARATAAALAAAGQEFGGAGPGGRAQVTLRLATRLPGWGGRAMAGLGLDAAADLTAPGDLGAVTAAAARYTPFAGVPEFAAALARSLGEKGLTYLLAMLGQLAGTGAGGEVAGLLARGLSAAGAAGNGDALAPAERLLDPQDPDGGADVVAVGMGVVLAAPGAAAGLAAAWGRAALEREHARGAGAVALSPATGHDPVDAALQVLVRTADRDAAAHLLGSSDVWASALTRRWSDGGSALRAVIGLSARAPAGGHVAEAALAALGRGLAPGSTVAATDDRGSLAAVRGAVGHLVAVQVDRVVVLLGRVVAAGQLDAATDTALRGLGLLLGQPGQGDVVSAAVVAALRRPPGGVDPAELAGAHVAVLEYGQRVRHALDCARELAETVDRAILGQEVKAAVYLLTSGGGPGLGRAAVRFSVDPLLQLWHADGTVVLPPDTGTVHTADDAAELAEALLPGTAAAGRAGFGRATAVLGVPTPPPPDAALLIDEFDPPDRSHDPRPTVRAGR